MRIVQSQNQLFIVHKNNSICDPSKTISEAASPYEGWEMITWNILHIGIDRQKFFPWSTLLNFKYLQTGVFSN